MKRRHVALCGVVLASVSLVMSRPCLGDMRDGDAMKNLRESGVTRETAPMINLTRELAEDVSRIIELLARMPPPSSMAPPSR